MFKTNQPKETMETIKEMIVYLEENQGKVDNEITDNKKAQEIFNDIENLKNKLEDISLT
tara:strand:+ start:602 stop:778 length:177 start_codon:yes stop_codon:yes gene_type:complete